MSVSLVPRSPAARRGVAAAGLLAVAAALSIGTLWRPDLAGEAGRSISQRGAGTFRTVAAMLADRSPGERLDGALAMLKGRRAPLLHARALPKVRVPQPFAILAGPPPIPAVVPPIPAAPLYNLVAGVPPAIVPVGTMGGPPITLTPGAFFAVVPGGGGGGGVPPPVVSVPPETPVTPVTPVTPTLQTSGVPEPTSWIMMLIGFALIGGTIREKRRLAS